MVTRVMQVCEEARCPNIGECWGGGEGTATATIMVGFTMGPSLVCTLTQVLATGLLHTRYFCRGYHYKETRISLFRSDILCVYTQMNYEHRENRFGLHNFISGSVTMFAPVTSTCVHTRKSSSLTFVCTR